MRGFCLLLIVAFIGCNQHDHIHKGKTVFRYNQPSALTSLDPAFAKDQATMWGCTQLYNGLVQLDSNLHILPSIAERWEISEDNKSYTFHLRNDVYFQDDKAFPDGRGRKVTANDFVYSLHRLVDQKVAAPGAWVMNPVARDSTGELAGIAALDDSTLLITLQKPFSPFLSILSMTYCSVVPREAVEFYKSDFREHPVGTGPFRFKLWKEGVKLILLKNENYFEQKDGVRLPYLDAVEVSFISDRQSAFIEFLKGNFDFLNSIDVSYKDELLKRNGELQSKYKGQFKMRTKPYLNTEHLDILMDPQLPAIENSPLKNKLIREALSCGFDRQSMMAFLRNNIGTPGVYGMVPPGLPTFDTTMEKKYVYNPSRSKALLKEAGYPDGQGLPVITVSTDPLYLDLCEFIKAQWERLGFKIKIDVNQGGIQRKLAAEQKLPFFRASWIADYPDPENYLALFYSKNFTPGGPNYTHYSNKEFDLLYEQATTETNDERRYQLYHLMDDMVMRDVPVIVLYYDQIVHLVHNNISGLHANAMNLLVLKEVKKELN